MDFGPPEPIISMRNSMQKLFVSSESDSESETKSVSSYTSSQSHSHHSILDEEEIASNTREKGVLIPNELHKRNDNGINTKVKDLTNSIDKMKINMEQSIDINDHIKLKDQINSDNEKDCVEALKSTSTMNKHSHRKNNKKTKKNRQEPPCRDPPVDGIWPKRDYLSFTRSLIFYGYGAITKEHETAANYIQEARNLRKKYFGSSETVVNNQLKDLLVGCKGNQYNVPPISYRFGSDGILELFAKDDNDQKSPLITLPDIDSFIQDYERLVHIATSGSLRTFSFQRLQMLTQAFKMHITANGAVENEAQSNLLGTDFYRTMKVDNHIHLAAAPSAKQFVNFVRNKLMTEGDTVVLEDGKTLRQVFTEAGLDLEHLTIDAFNVLADYSVYQRFDNFNSKYSPFRLAHMRKIFLKTSNHMKGRYFAELTKIILARHEASKGHNSAAEMRISIYGMERDEWLQLAKWVLRKWDTNKGDEDLFSPGPVLSTHNRWLVQIPRLWRIFHAKPRTQKNVERSFQDMLENLFTPIVEATLDPEANPEVAELLTHIVGFDSVDDEGSIEEPCSCVRPSKWSHEKNPAFCWQLYFLWANIEVINKLRESKGLNTFAFRPHAGETGDVMHLAASYMLCRSINHGINLDRQVSLQYLYYLDQVRILTNISICYYIFCYLWLFKFKFLFFHSHNLNCVLTKKKNEITNKIGWSFCFTSIK